jgi:hypothetical protein
VVDLHAALQEHLLDVAVAQRVAQTPGHGLDDEAGLEVPAPEVATGFSLQLEGKLRMPPMPTRPILDRVARAPVMMVALARLADIVAREKLRQATGSTSVAYAAMVEHPAGAQDHD